MSNDLSFYTKKGLKRMRKHLINVLEATPYIHDENARNEQIKLLKLMIEEVETEIGNR